MGLTNKSTGNSILNENVQNLKNESDFVIGLVGNPNVGKSSVFNGLTGLHQHTGNWPGKTIENSYGTYQYDDKQYLLVDLPGTYSLDSYSKEEEVTNDFIDSNEYDGIVVVVDATSLERNLNLALQILERTKRVVICVNLLDEAKKKGIDIDLDKLSEILGVPVVGTVATKKKTLEVLKENVSLMMEQEQEEIVNKCEIEEIIDNAERIADIVVSKSNFLCERDRKIDKVLTSKKFGIPIMIAMLGVIFWITIIGANYPSEFLTWIFGIGRDYLKMFFEFCCFPSFLSSLLIDGVYQTVTWIISVMLPPMAIFFPLFTLLEDLGVLPRIAFNLDNFFRRAGTCGKQALTMCMGVTKWEIFFSIVGILDCKERSSVQESYAKRSVAYNQPLCFYLAD